MHATSCPSPTHVSRRKPVWKCRRWSSRRASVSIELAALGVFCLGLIGCENTPTNEQLVDPRTSISADDMVRGAKHEFQECLSAFYVDDWPRVLKAESKMELLADRWKQQTPLPNHKANFEAETKKYSDAVHDLRLAADKRDVLQTTQALRRIAASIAVIENMK